MTVKTVLAAVATAEADPEGIAAAELALANELPIAEGKLFPTGLSPTTADAVAQYGLVIGRLAIPTYGVELAKAHERALLDNEPLAALCRSPEALDDVAYAAARDGEAARRRYKATIAAQLAARDGHALRAAAKALLEIYALAERLAIARTRHEELAAAKLAAQEAEAKAAVEQALASRVAQVSAVRRELEDAHAVVTRLDRGLRDLQAEVLGERIRASGLEKLEIADRGRLHVWSSAMILDQLGSWGREQLDLFEAALQATVAGGAS